MNENKGKNKYVTEEYLDKRFGEQTQVLLGAFDSILVKRTTEAKEDLRSDINSNQIVIDGYVNAQENFRQEFEIMKAEFGQMKKIIKKKLGLEIKAT